MSLFRDRELVNFILLTSFFIRMESVMINISYFTCDPPSLDKRYKVEGFRYNCCYRNADEAITALEEQKDEKIIIYRDTGKHETEIYRGAVNEKAVEAVKGISEW